MLRAGFESAAQFSRTLDQAANPQNIFSHRIRKGGLETAKCGQRQILEVGVFGNSYSFKLEH